MKKEELESHIIFFETLVEVIDKNRVEEVWPVLKNYVNEQVTNSYNGFEYNNFFQTMNDLIEQECFEASKPYFKDYAIRQIEILNERLNKQSKNKAKEVQQNGR